MASLLPSRRHPVVSEQIARDIVNGNCNDPFAYLGKHKIAGQTYVTALVPNALTVQVSAEDRLFPLAPIIGVNGLFFGLVPETLDGYSLIAQNAHGHCWTSIDPYQFSPVIGALDLYWFREGTHKRLWQVLGAHVMTHEQVLGTHFAVWAPNAFRVSVVGDFNYWNGCCHLMRRLGDSGIWEIFIPEVGEGANYKYELIDRSGCALPLRSDPLGFGAQHPPENASVVRDIGGYGWRDQSWMQTRKDTQKHDTAVSIYEVHLGSWRRRGARMLSYIEAAKELINYVRDMGFTHIELMPVSEYPFDGSWGYQPVGLFAPTVRHGPAHEFRDLIDAAHRAQIGVILDWVPGHFPTDAHGLGNFDGTHLYEHADPREGFHQDWNTLIFNYGRIEVCNYLVANALYWLKEYHIDGLRVDAVASMLYRNYSREPGQWVPNKDGGQENYEAIEMLQKMNCTVYGEVEGIVTMAEESTSFPGVSKPVDQSGLGFGFKWNMGWMNDTLDYMQRDPLFRKHHHNQMTFGIAYAFSENFILPISHDEVVHGKGSMLNKMPGNDEEKFANLRAYYLFMWGHPGKKLLFMGCEFAQRGEWNHDAELDWGCLADAQHLGMQALVRDLNHCYQRIPALYELDTQPEGFEWIKVNEADESLFVWLRRDRQGNAVVVVCNMTPVMRRDYRIGLPCAGLWGEVINTDAAVYGGQNRGNLGQIVALDQPCDGQCASALISIAPLSGIILTFLNEAP